MSIFFHPKTVSAFTSFSCFRWNNKDISPLKKWCTLNKQQKKYFLVLSIFVMTPKKHVSSISAVDGSTKNTLRFKKKWKNLQLLYFMTPSLSRSQFPTFLVLMHFSTFLAFPQRIFTFWHPNLSYLTLFLYLGE